MKHRAVLRCAFAVALAASSASFGDARPHRVPALPVVPGFEVVIVARMPEPRQLAAAPNGDLLVGTAESVVYIVRKSEGMPERPRVFAHFADDEAAGVSLDGASVFVGTEHGVWRLPYGAEPAARPASRNGSPPCGRAVATTTSRRALPRQPAASTPPSGRRATFASSPIGLARPSRK